MSKVATLWVKRIKNDSRKFSEVPAGLKEEVRKSLKTDGYGHLVKE